MVQQVTGKENNIFRAGKRKIYSMDREKKKIYYGQGKEIIYSARKRKKYITDKEKKNIF